jgi:hypothetical protein
MMILAGSEYYISVNNKDILKFSKVIESCVLALFMLFYTKYVLTKSSVTKCGAVAFTGAILETFCVYNRERPPSPTHHPASSDVIKYALL